MELIFQTPSGELKTIALQPQDHHHYMVQIEDRTYAAIIDRLPSGQLRINLEGKTLLVTLASEGSNHHLALNAKRVQLQKTTRRTNQRGTAAQEGDLTANLPAQVTKILVSSGDFVEKGQALVILEAMKMEMRIRAPQDGQVKAILCELGQAVERGQKLVELAYQGSN